MSIRLAFKKEEKSAVRESSEAKRLEIGSLLPFKPEGLLD
jgi:hypothetical protein